MKDRHSTLTHPLERDNHTGNKTIHKKTRPRKKNMIKKMHSHDRDTSIKKQETRNKKQENNPKKT